MRQKIEESEKADSHWESNTGHRWLEPPVLYHWATTAGRPLTLTILYVHCTDVLNASVAHLADMMVDARYDDSYYTSYSIFKSMDLLLAKDDDEGEKHNTYQY